MYQGFCVCGGGEVDEDEEEELLDGRDRYD